MFRNINTDQSFLKEKALRYRVSLIKERFSEEDEKLLIASFYKRIDFNLSNSFFINRVQSLSVTRSQKIGRDFKNSMMFLYFYNRSKNIEFKKIDSFLSETKNFLLSGYEKIEKIKGNLSSKYLESKDNTSRIIQKRFFENNSNLRRRENKDPRLQIGFADYQNLSSNQRELRLPEYSRKQVKAKEIFLLEEKSFLGNLRGPISYGEIKNLQNEEDIFDFVVFQRILFESKKRKNLKPVSFTVLFDFIGNEKLNEINIKTACLYDLSIEKIIYNKDETNILDFKQRKGSDGFTLFFAPIKVKSLEITFKQEKYLDLQDVSSETEEDIALRNTYLRYSSGEFLSENGAIYDLSLKQVSFFYSVFRKKGNYIDTEEIQVNRPASVQMSVEYLYDRDIVYTEKYIQATLFGESGIDPLNNKKQNNKADYYRNLRLNKMLPIPTRDGIEKELLVIRNKRAVLRFEPKESPRIYKNGEEYNNISIVGKSIIINGDIKKSDIYHAEYSVKENSYLEDNIKVQNGKIVFENEYKDSSGYILPVIIMRSGVRTNDDTDIISSFQIDIQEKEETINNNLQNINSQEVYSGSSSNVT